MIVINNYSFGYIIFIALIFGVGLGFIRWYLIERRMQKDLKDIAKRFEDINKNKRGNVNVN